MAQSDETAYRRAVPFPDAHPALLRALAEHGYDEPTEVQTAVLVPEADGRDLLVSSRTGSGKTVAFGMAFSPQVIGLQERLGRPTVPYALVIAPTRELAQQVQRELAWLYAYTGARVIACVGGMDVRREQRSLRDGAHVVVGTPGRLCDHLDHGFLKVDELRVVVLDEADEMLDMGFRDELEHILAGTPPARRTLLFSATLPSETISLANKVQRDALRIAATDPRQAHVDIEYRAVLVAPRERDHAVVNLLRHLDPAGALVFCNTRDGVTHLQANLLERGFAATAISGELTQSERTRALQTLRDGRARVLVATDVAARGLDLPSLDVVIHADLPYDAQGLLHRSGRTGRAGRKGIAVLVVPAPKRRFAERLFRDARIQPIRGVPPTADEIELRDRERLVTELGARAATVSEEDLTVARTLLETHAPEALVAVLVASYRERLPAPEELPITQSMHRAGPATERPARGPRAPSDREETVWFRINVGRAEDADPRWLLPLICRRGGVTKRQIGRIEIDENESRFQVQGDSADRFEEMARRRDRRSPNIQIGRAP